MHVPSLSQLPAPPVGRTGWPWDQESSRLPDARPDGSPWPKLSVITVSYNQAQFLEGTIRSILLQGYPHLEYYVVDGGSNDGSVELIKKYAPWLTGWVCERDRGQSDAINKGLRRASGVLAAWVNSDDMLHRDALHNHALQNAFRPDTLYVGDCAIANEAGEIQRYHRGRVRTFEDLLRLRNVWRNRGHIVQPEVFFPLEATLATGGLNEGNHYTMDFELWGRLLLRGIQVCYTTVPFGIFRVRAGQKVSDRLATTASMVASASSLARAHPSWPESTKRRYERSLSAYEAEVKDGRAARASRLTCYLRRLRERFLLY